jgi:MOSC domain-containing protein YiiM
MPYTRQGTASAIAKQAVQGPASVGFLGLEGDEQADRRFHGGPDKALHHYAFDHYEAWRGELGRQHPMLARPGAFGENLSSHGITESTLCMGDRLRIGSVLVEVSQARQPCWKLNDRFGWGGMARRVQDSMRTGWYYRVLEPGVLQVGDAIDLVDRPHPAWSLARLLELLYVRTLDLDQLALALALPLTPSWRALVERRLARGEVEAWAPRFDGPQTTA